MVCSPWSLAAMSPASAGQPLPAQTPVPRPVLPESCGADEPRAAGATGGGKGRLIFLYSSPVTTPSRGRNAQTVTSLDAHVKFRWQPTAPVTMQQGIFTAFGWRTASEDVGL